MAGKSTPAQLAALELLRKFPKAPTLTLAKRAYKESPELWSNLQNARACFGRLRGAWGRKGLSEAKDHGVRRAKQPAGYSMKLPSTLVHGPKWAPLQLSGPFQALVFGDTHVPYHDRPAIQTMVRHAKKRRVDVVIVNGDMIDMFALSRWEKDPRKRKFAPNAMTSLEFLRWLRATFPKARIIWKLGNHEERFESYMWTKAPELLDVPQFQFEAIYELEQVGVELVRDKRPIRAGDVNIIHGHEYRFAISNPVNAARGLFLRGKCHAITNHFHQSSQHSEKSLESKVISTWSLGCLCDLHPDYMPLNNHNHGFAQVEVDAANAFHVENSRIIGSKVY